MVKKRRSPAQIRATKKLVALNKRLARKKSTVKKRRTPAQRKATKKLVALNKKRARKKNPVKRKASSKVSKRMVTKRKVNPSRGYYYILAKNIKTGREGYYTGKSFDTTKSKAILSKTKSVMVALAKNISINRREWNVYVGSK